MKLYHGSTVAVQRPLTNVGRGNLDFGQGFYLTDLLEQAVSWARRPANADKPHILNIYDFDMEAALDGGARYRRFEEYNGEWLDFVVANRRGGSQWEDYDIVEGGIANDRVFNTIELYMAGLISRNETLQRLRYEQPNNQICILQQSIINGYLQFAEARNIEKEDNA